MTDAEVERRTKFAFASTNETPYTGLCKHWYAKGLREGAALAQPAPVQQQEAAMCIAHGEALQRIGSALGLVAGTNLHTACVPAILALKEAAPVQQEAAGGHRDWERVRSFAKKIAALMDTKECAQSPVSGLCHDAGERAAWIERIARAALQPTQGAGGATVEAVAWTDAQRSGCTVATAVELKGTK